MPARVSHLEELVSKNWFTNLLSEEDVSNIQSLSEYLDFASNIMICKSFTTNKKSYFISLQGSPTFFGQFKDLNNKLLERLQLYLTEFDSKDLKSAKSELFFFDSTLIENSYDSNSISRDSIKLIFDEYYSYDEDFLNACLNAFDGGTATFVDGIRIDRKQGFNHALCFELGTNREDRSFERNSRIFKDIALLYDFEESQIDDWLEQHKSIMYSKNTRLCYQLKNSFRKKAQDLEVLVLPIDGQVFMTSNLESIQSFLEFGLIDELQANDLKDWNDYNHRTLSHFNLKLTKSKEKINTELEAFYGINLQEKIDPPYRPILSLEENPPSEEDDGEFYPENWDIGRNS